MYQFPAKKSDFFPNINLKKLFFSVINNFTLEKLPDARLLWEHPTTDIYSPISDKLTVMMTTMTAMLTMVRAKFTVKMTMVTAIPPKMLTVAMT